MVQRSGRTIPAREITREQRDAGQFEIRKHRTIEN